MKNPIVCADHRARTVTVRGCQICQRLALEADIVTRTVDALLAAGFLLLTNDGDEIRPSTPTADKAAILAELAEVDDEHLMIYKAQHNGTAEGWVRFVYGNDGWDVISDYTTNFEDVLKPVNAYVDSIAP
jgi:hypothetical protein